MRYLFLFFAMIGLYGCGTSHKVLTYNIFHGENPYHKGNSNLAGVAEVIRSLDPDVVFLQEVDSMTNRTRAFNGGRKVDVAGELGSLSGRSGYFAKAIDYSDGGYGEGMLIRKPADIIRATLPFPQGGEGRAMIAVKEKNIILAGTHLCHEYKANRLAQVDAIIRYYRETGLPMIIAGDFNFMPESEEYKRITEYFYDAAVLGNNVQFTFDADKPRGRIDYIFLSRNRHWKVKEVHTVQSLASDHLPLYAKVKMGK